MVEYAPMSLLSPSAMECPFDAYDELCHAVRRLLERSTWIGLTDRDHPVQRAPHFFAYGLRALFIKFAR